MFPVYLTWPGTQQCIIPVSHLEHDVREKWPLCEYGVDLYRRSRYWTQRWSPFSPMVITRLWTQSISLIMLVRLRIDPANIVCVAEAWFNSLMTRCLITMNKHGSLFGLSPTNSILRPQTHYSTKVIGAQLFGELRYVCLVNQEFCFRRNRSSHLMRAVHLTLCKDQLC